MRCSQLDTFDPRNNTASAETAGLGSQDSESGKVLADGTLSNSMYEKHPERSSFLRSSAWGNVAESGRHQTKVGAIIRDINFWTDFYFTYLQNKKKKPRLIVVEISPETKVLFTTNAVFVVSKSYLQMAGHHSTYAITSDGPCGQAPVNLVASGLRHPEFVDATTYF